MKPAIKVETAQCHWLNLGFTDQGWMVKLRSLLKIVPDASEGRLRVGLQQIVESTYPMDLVCMNFLSLEMSAGGYEHILVITDHFTRYAQAIPTKNQSAKTTARALFDNFICHYCFPAHLHSDQGRNFKERLLRSCVPLLVLIS